MPRVRRSLRTQLTLLYALPFLATGALLLTIPILQYSESAPASDRPPPPNGVEEATMLRPLLIATATALVLMAAVSFVLGCVIAGRFPLPLRTITATARDISATNLHRRLNLTARGDEFADSPTPSTTYSHGWTPRSPRSATSSPTPPTSCGPP